MSIRLETLSTTSGFLKRSKLEFSPGLNCIIGARGTCKSTVVETIRFAFDCDSDRVNQLCADTVPLSQSSSNRGMIRATLGAGVAKCEATRFGSDGHDDVSIEREIDGQPTVCRNGIEELADRDVLHMVEIYSQGDLQQIAQNESLRLDLIDRPNKSIVIELTDKRDTLAEQLRRVGETIRQKSRDIEARRADVRGLATLKEQLVELQAQRPELSAELDEERSAATSRSQIIDAVTSGVQDSVTIRQQVRNAIECTSDFAKIAELLKEVKTPASQHLAATFTTMGRIQNDIRQIIEAAENDGLETAVEELRGDFEKLNRRYYQLRQEQQEVTDSLKKEDGLKKQIDHLSKLQLELDAFIVEQEQLIKKRTELRTQMQSIADKIHELRQKEVDGINNVHGEVVILTLNLGITSDEYASMLESLLAGSRIRGQDDVAREISEQFRPCDLIDIVEAADSERLATVLDRDLSQMARLVSHLMDNPNLYDLESIVFDDKLDITFYDQGAPKSIRELSKGQMATALLPLILRPAPYPLIFDQPEDDLDNSFIYKTLVQKIQKLKEQRQLIFVTHNANIPVLGDADSVIVMEMNSPTVAATPSAGTIDEVKSAILSLLEGGLEAFRLRQERYEGLLQDVSDNGQPAAIDN